MATANALKQTTDLINNFFEEDEIDDRKVDGRFQPRPGKSNLHGRKDYCNSTRSADEIRLSRSKIVSPQISCSIQTVHNTP